MHNLPPVVEIGLPDLAKSGGPAPNKCLYMTLLYSLHVVLLQNHHHVSNADIKVYGVQMCRHKAAAGIPRS